MLAELAIWAQSQIRNPLSATSMSIQLLASRCAGVLVELIEFRG